MPETQRQRQAGIGDKFFLIDEYPLTFYSGFGSIE
jgi:hypothetical protein